MVKKTIEEEVDLYYKAIKDGRMNPPNISEEALKFIQNNSNTCKPFQHCFENYQKHYQLDQIA